MCVCVWVCALKTHFGPQVEGELSESLVMHVDEREDLEEPLNGCEVLVPDRLLEAGGHHLFHLGLGIVQDLQGRVQGGDAKGGHDGEATAIVSIDTIGPDVRGGQLEQPLIHGQEPVQVRRRLLVVLLHEGRPDAVAAQLQVNQVVHSLLTLGHATLEEEKRKFAKL